MRRGGSLFCAVVFLGVLPMLPQRPAKPARSAADSAAATLRSTLRQLLAPVHIVVPDESAATRDQPARELHLAWTTIAAPSGGQPETRLRMLSEPRTGDVVPRQRSLGLADDKLLVAAVDATDTLRGWTVIPDPRFLRSERPGPDGVLTGRVVSVARPEFLVTIPDDARIVEVRFFQPRAQPDGFSLQLVAALSVQPRRDSIK